MFRTASCLLRNRWRLLLKPNSFQRQFSLVNDISVRKRLTIGIGGFLLATTGVVASSMYIRKNRMAKQIKEEANEPVIDESVVPIELPPPVNVISEDDDSQYLPWWTGITEISIYLNDENAKVVDDHFTPSYPVVPRRKAVLVFNPHPEDSNEYGPLMGDEIDMKVVAMIQDEHVQVLLLDLGTTPSIYLYPNLVVSCQDSDASSSYSSIYGRLLIDRAVKAGLFTESEHGYIPVQDVENIELAKYHDYPESHVTIKDLRDAEIVVKGRLCSSRGMDGKNDICNEAKHESECSWCVFMKGGPCFKSFTRWQKCVADNREDDAFIDKCMEMTLAMKECVEAHEEYYGKMYKNEPAENIENAENDETADAESRDVDESIADGSAINQESEDKDDDSVEEGENSNSSEKAYCEKKEPEEELKEIINDPDEVKHRE